MRTRITRWRERSGGLVRPVAFSLIEMLVVIAIIGILAAVAVPTMNSFKPNVMAAATQQLLADVNRARQLAISQRTTVYMVFVPTNYFSNAYSSAYSQLPASEQARADRLLDKQVIGYNFISLHSLGDQPGTTSPKYYSAWRTLPEGTFIPLWKYQAPKPDGWTEIKNEATGQTFFIPAFAYTNIIPFPTEQAALAASAAPYVPLPYIAFNYQGALVSGRDEIIPLARGSVSFGRNVDRSAAKRPPSVNEMPPGNSTNSSFNLIYIDKLTGRARAVRQEVQ